MSEILLVQNFTTLINILNIRYVHFYDLVFCYIFQNTETKITHYKHEQWTDTVSTTSKYCKCNLYGSTQHAPSGIRTSVSGMGDGPLLLKYPYNILIPCWNNRVQST